MLEGNVARRKKALLKLAGEGAELMEKITVLQADYGKVQANFAAKEAELERDQAALAAVLACKADAAGKRAGTAAPPAAAAAPAATEALLQALGTMPGVTDAHRSVLDGLFELFKKQDRNDAGAQQAPVPKGVSHEFEAHPTELAEHLLGVPP